MKAKHSKPSAQAVVKDIRRATREQYGAEEKIRIVPEGLRGEDTISNRPRLGHRHNLCRADESLQRLHDQSRNITL